jgi:hypothetical protein
MSENLGERRHGRALATKGAQALRERLAGLVERELSRCRAKLGEDAWRAHGEWVTAHVAASAKEWAVQQARRGDL